ncbi:MAG: T9SS type A sorting domain-containing protein [bacterium]|nr:T9SS type A sorting domain-containing protein [bacterium]
MSRKWLTGLVFALSVVLAAGASAQVVINELLYDTIGDDDPNLLYVELWGPAGTDLTGWSLIGINGNGGTVYRTVTLSGSIPQDGYYVVGNTASVPNVDYVCGGAMGAGIDWQNAGSSSGEDCDGVDLMSGATLVDHLCYGTCGSGHVSTGEGGENAPDPYPTGGINYALARIPDHQDTGNNGTDWSSTDQQTPGAPNSGEPCDPQYVTLLDIRENDGNGVSVLNGTFVVVRGVVNVNNYTLDSLTESSFYIQDDDAGCNVFRGTVPAGITEKDCVEVSGWVSQYNGLTELVSSGSGNCVFSVDVVAAVDTVMPTLINGATFFEQFEGMLVRMNNVSIIDGTWPGQGQWANLTITDGNGTITLRIDEDTNVDGSPAPPATFDVMGIITQFDNSSPYTTGYQITPRYATDVIRGTAAEDPAGAPVAGEFRLVDVYPNPFNSTARIRFEVGSARELTVTISDVLGRELLRENLTGLTPGAHDFSWTPNAATGVYLLRMSGGGTVQTAKLLYLR